MKQLVFWIKNNHQWFFSGLGVLILSTTIALVSYCMREPASQSAKPLFRSDDKSRITSIPTVVQVPKPEIANQALEALRQQHQVMFIDPLYNDLELSRLPKEVFAYVSGDYLQEKWVTVHDDDNVHTSFEVHKLSSGQTLLIGFVSTDTALRLRREDRSREFEFTLYSYPWSDASTILSLPIDQLVSSHSHRVIHLGDSYFGALDLSFKSQ